MRRPLALLLAAVLAVLDPALRAGPSVGRAFAAEPDSNEAVAFLNKSGVFKGEDDPLRTYVVDQKTNQLSSIGRIIYDYLKQGKEDPKDRLRDFQPTFEAMRQAGPATPQMLQAAAKAQGDLQTRFSDVFDMFKGGQGQPAAAGDAAFIQSAMLSVGFDGAAKAREEAKYIQFETDDGFVFMDKEGVAVRMAKNWSCRHQSWAQGKEPLLMNKQQFDSFKSEHESAGDFDQWACGAQGGVTTFSRDIQKSQQSMNRAQGKPACAPRVPETGRYNYEMLAYSDCLVQQDVDRSSRGYKIDMIVKLATLLTENVSEDDILKKTDTLFAQLKAKGEGKSLNKFDQYCGKVVENYYKLAECKLAKRKEYVDQAVKFAKAYHDRVEGYKNRAVITQQEIQGLTADEALVKKYLTLAFLEAQRNQAYTQLEGVSMEVFKVTADGDYVDAKRGRVHLKKGDYLNREVTDSPDSKQLREALNKGPFDKATKDNYMKRAADLAERVRRLLLVYDRLETELKNTDHTGSMSMVQGALFSTQKELGEVGLDSRLYSAVPIMAHLGHEENDGWSRSVYKWGAKLFGAKGYVQKREDLEKYMPGLKNMASMIARGDFNGAREEILKLDPDAQRTHWQVEAGSAGDDPSRMERTEAVLRKVNQTVTGLMKTHMWLDIGRDIIVSSVVLAVAAPAAAAVLSGVAKTAFSVANAVGNGTRVARIISTTARIVGSVAEHTAIRLQSLSPAANTLRQRTAMGRVLTATMVRGVNAGVRHAVFALGMSGGVSGGINWAMNDFKAEAFVQGYQSGASWGAKNAWVLYAGLPSTAFEETWLARGAGSLADRGLAGNVAAAGQWGLGKIGVETGANIVDRGLGAMMNGGFAARAGATVLSMGDQFAKYYAFNKVMEVGAYQYSYRMNSFDHDDVERRIKRATQAGQAAMEASILGIPAWAFIPTFSAKTALQVEQMQRSNQGMAEYKAAGETHRIANAAADVAELPLKNAPSRPFINRLFEFNLMEATGEKGTFKVTKEMKYEAIRLELENSVRGPNGVPASPSEYFRISQQEGGMAGRLHVTDEVRDQAQGLFEKAMLENPKLAGDVLAAQAGSKVEGFGRVRLAHQEEVARIIYTNQSAKGVSKAHIRAAETVLAPSIETERSVGTAAKDLLEAIGKTKEPTPAYQKFVDGMLERTRSWKNDPAQVKKVGYMDLVAEFREGAPKANLSVEEAGVISKMADYFQAIEKRLNHFNTVGSAAQRAEKALGALRLEASTGGASSKAVVETLDGMLTSVAKWRDAQPSLTTTVGRSFNEMVQTLNDSVKALKGKVTAGDMSLLSQAVKEVQASPALLRNPKGDGLMSWRPEQFEGLMHFMRSISMDGANSSEVIRTFLRMKTGGGKTMLAFEGLLPIAEADGALHGGKLKSIFLTVQSNLESQARLDYRASKKVLAKLDIDTWEGFKTRIAQNKLEAKGGADEYWILGDEMDGAALQPALTIGETTAGVSRDNTGYRLLKTMGDRMKEVLDRGPAELRNKVESEVRRQQSLVDAMEPGETQTKLRATTEELVSLGQRMEQLQRRGDVAGLDKLAKRFTKVLENQEALLKGSAEPTAKQVLEAGARISESVSQRVTLGAGDMKLAKTLIGDMLREQEAIVNQTAPQGKAQARALEKLAAAQRAEGNIAEAAKLEAQAKAIRQTSVEARTGLEANSKAMREALKGDGAPGWETQFRKLVAERQSLVDNAVAHENPIYETFKRMREDMYGLVNSKLRTTQRWERLAETPAQTHEALVKAADQLSADAQALAKKVKAEGTPDAARRAEQILTSADQQAAALRQKAVEAKTRLESPLNAEQSAAYEARQQAGGMLERAEAKLFRAQAELKAAGASPRAELADAVATAKEEVARWRTDYQKANTRIESFEGARADAARSILEGLRADAAKALQTLQPNLNGLKGPEAEAIQRNLTSLERSMDVRARRMEWTPEKAVDVLQRRIAGVPTSEYVARTALKYTGAQWVMSKLPGVSETKWAKPMTPTDVGLTRIYARELVGNFLSDPFMPPSVRWKMLWTLLPSTLMPRGVTGRGSSWVLTELLNLATGYTDNPANIRMDNITGRVNVIHNGQWFDSMDTPTRRFWELEYKADLTLPYDHKTQVTMNDFVRDNKNVRFVGFSGTAGEKFRDYLGKYGVKIVGVGSEGAKDVGLNLSEGPAGKFKAIGDAVREAIAHDQAQVAAGKQADALVVLSLPDTRMVREVRRYLLKTGALTPDQIAMVFSDSELLRLNRPEADVSRQMNLEGLNGGKVKILMLDTRVGGRGLDLNFKGKRNPGPTDFGGYFDFKMLVVDPQLASEAHFLQAQGRIDLGRIHSNVDPGRAYHPEAAQRKFVMVMDIETAAKDPVFLRMIRTEPVFQQLSRHPDVVETAYRNGRFSPAWSDMQEFINASKAAGKDGFVVQRYEETVRRYLAEKQLQVELDQLRSAGVLHEAGSFDPFLYGLSPVAPGTPYPGAP